MKKRLALGLKLIAKRSVRLATGLQHRQDLDQVALVDQRADKKLRVSLDVDFWQEQPITFVYFVYLNPMFVLSVWFGGYQCVVINLTSVYVLSLVRETELARKNG